MVALGYLLYLDVDRMYEIKEYFTELKGKVFKSEVLDRVEF